MYIKLTRFDNTPVWLNAAFIVTIEPRRQGGSIVVPIGDGLDYEVRETPDAVLAMLEDAPAATVVPVPTTDALTRKPDDVSAEPMVMTAEDAVELKDDPEPEATPAPETEPEPAPAKKKPAKKAPARRTRTRKSEAAPAPALGDEQIERLRRMAPGSVKKLANTLSSQFKIENADGAIQALAEKGVLKLDRDHVVWNETP